MAGQYWLLKTEPEEWGWEHQRSNGGMSVWDGVKNALAQKNMKAMQLGDLCFFYHTGKEKAVVGIVSVTATWYPEKADTSPPEGEEGSSKQKWGNVDVREVLKLDNVVTLSQIKAAEGTTINEFLLIRQPRLSVVPVSEENWRAICEMGGLVEAPKAPWKGGLGLGSELAQNGVAADAGLAPAERTSAAHADKMTAVNVASTGLPSGPQEVEPQPELVPDGDGPKRGAVRKGLRDRTLSARLRGGEQKKEQEQEQAQKQEAGKLPKTNGSASKPRVRKKDAETQQAEKEEKKEPQPQPQQRQRQRQQKPRQLSPALPPSSQELFAASEEGWINESGRQSAVKVKPITYSRRAKKLSQPGGTGESNRGEEEGGKAANPQEKGGGMKVHAKRGRKRKGEI
eukprot:jgi/Mesen1/193/ME1137347C07570